MFERSRVSFVPSVAVLAGVVLLIMSVFHALLLWLAVLSLGAGLSLLLVECLGSLLRGTSSASFAVPPAAEPKKES